MRFQCQLYLHSSLHSSAGTTTASFFILELDWYTFQVKCSFDTTLLYWIYWGFSLFFQMIENPTSLQKTSITEVVNWCSLYYTYISSIATLRPSDLKHSHTLSAPTCSAAGEVITLIQSQIREVENSWSGEWRPWSRVLHHGTCSSSSPSILPSFPPSFCTHFVFTTAARETLSLKRRVWGSSDSAAVIIRGGKMH